MKRLKEFLAGYRTGRVDDVIFGNGSHTLVIDGKRYTSWTNFLNIGGNPGGKTVVYRRYRERPLGQPFADPEPHAEIVRVVAA